jgi:hypothetical protein
MRKTLIILVVLGVTLFAVTFTVYPAIVSTPEPIPEASLPPLPAEASSEQVHQLCAHCHAYPPADSFPKAHWRHEVKQGYEFFRDSSLQLDYPSIESVVQYYEKRAPDEFSVTKADSETGPAPVRFVPRGYRLPENFPHPAITNVNLVHLFDKTKLDILACDMRYGRVMVLRPYLPSPTWQIIGEVSAPAHAEVVDLDGDGILDILVANLGSFNPTDDRVGSVVWLRGMPDGTFKPFTLLDGVGRVADVQAASFKGDGKKDLVVAVFGWRNTGEILYLENRTTDWSKPVFVPHVLDERHGAIHVPVCDLNKDGKPDFVALISQEHETIVAFLNEGNGRFRKETIYTAPHPAYGSSGIQVVDLNGDGNLDVLYTNGDVLDTPSLLKPYHGVQWLENQGEFPFVHHPLTPMYGAMRAVAADFTGKGKMDIVAVCYLPEETFPQRKELNLDAIIYLEQVAPGRFVRHSLEKTRCDHLTCVVGDIFGDGRMHFVSGNHFINTENAIPEAVEIWENLGPGPAGQKDGK